MQNFSESYRDIMFDEAQTHHLRGTIDGISFDEDDVESKSTVWNGVCSNQNVLIGSAAITSLKITFSTVLLPRYAWEGKTLIIEDGTVLPDSSIEWKRIGTFIVGEANWTNVGTIEVVAYDCLSLMDDDLDFDITSGTMFDIMQLIQTKTGAVCGMTTSEVAQLPNSSIEISPYVDSNMKTYRDMLSKLAQLAGGFAYAKRDGTFAIRSFDNTSVISIPLNRRKKNAKYSDFKTRFDYMSYVNAETGDTVYFGEINGYGMELGENPFLVYGLESTLEQMGQAIWEKVQLMQYTPFQAEMLPSFCVLDLGDVVTFLDDYTGNDSSGAIMSMTWTYGVGLKIQCYGSKPNLKKAKSSTDNALTGLRNKTKSNGLTYKTFINSEVITLDQTPQELFKIKFLTVDDTTVEMWHEAKTLNVLSGDTQSVRYYWYLDGRETGLFNEPVDTFGEDGLHTQSHPYWRLKIDGGIQHTWEVWADVDSGTATIDVSNLHALLKGQKMVAEEAFDGDLPELEDVIEPRIVLGLPLASLTDAMVELKIDAPVPDLTLADSFTASNRIVLGLPIASLTESDGIPVIWQPLSDYITESGDELITENGYILTTEGVDD